MKSPESSKFRYYFWLFVIITIAGTGIALSVALNAAGLGWLWGLVVIFLAYLVALAVIKGATHEGVVTILEEIIPGVRAFVELQRKKYEYRGEIDKVEYALEYYLLTKYLNLEDKLEEPVGHYIFTERLREYLLDAMLKIKVDKKEIATCIEKVAERLQPPVSSKVIELLYKEIFKEDTQILFADIKQNAPVLNQLAWSLIQSGRLPPANENFPYDEETVCNILRGQEFFALKDVREALLEEERIWRVTQEYHAFLIQNNAAVSPNKRTLKEVQESAAHEGSNLLLRSEFSNQLSREEIRTLFALLMEGEKALKRGPVRDACRGDALPAMTLTSLAMFFTEERLDRPRLKSAVCMLASRSTLAVKQHLAYLQAREDLRPEASHSDFPYVSVQYVAENWERTIKKLDGNPRYNREMDAVRNNLSKGSWWTRIPPFIEELFRQMGEELKNEIRETMILQKRFPGVEDILRRIFRGLKLETIERLLEAQTTIAYLLTFDGQEGNLAEVIDSLSFFDGGDNRIKLERKKVVKFKHKDEEKYFFQHYTSHTRLGVVPKGMRFEDFFKTFERDLIKVYQNRNLLELGHPHIDKFEIIIHRFGLHGRDRYGFEKVESKSQYKHALPKIRDLFASSLTPEEILKAIFYEQPKDKNGRVDMLPIMKDILKDGLVWDFTEEKTVDLSENAIKTVIKNDARLKRALLRDLHGRSLLDAARLLYNNAKASQQTPVQDATNALKLEIQQLPGFKKLNAQANLIASNYVEMLIDIAGVIDSLSAQPFAALSPNTPAPST